MINIKIISLLFNYFAHRSLVYYLSVFTSLAFITFFHYLLSAIFIFIFITLFTFIFTSLSISLSPFSSSFSPSLPFLYLTQTYAHHFQITTLHSSLLLVSHKSSILSKSFPNTSSPSLTPMHTGTYPVSALPYYNHRNLQIQYPSRNLFPPTLCAQTINCQEISQILSTK